MEEFWASRLHSANNLSAALSNNSDDMDADTDMKAWFPCPFCYVDIQVSAVCLHLQEEHCFDIKNAVCPICAANLGKDAIGHFTTQHAHRRRRSPKSGSRSNNSTVPGKDMREVYLYRGLQSTDGESDMHELAPDPLLSPFLCSTPLPNPESNADALTSCNTALTTSEAKSTKSAMLDEAQEQDYREQKQRAAFVQQNGRNHKGRPLSCKNLWMFRTENAKASCKS